MLETPGIFVAREEHKQQTVQSEGMNVQAKEVVLCNSADGDVQSDMNGKEESTQQADKGMKRRESGGCSEGKQSEEKKAKVSIKKSAVDSELITSQLTTEKLKQHFARPGEKDEQYIAACKTQIEKFTTDRDPEKPIPDSYTEQQQKDFVGKYHCYLPKDVMRKAIEGNVIVRWNGRHVREYKDLEDLVSAANDLAKFFAPIKHDYKTVKTEAIRTCQRIIERGLTEWPCQCKTDFFRAVKSGGFTKHINRKLTKINCHYCTDADARKKTFTSPDALRTHMFSQHKDFFDDEAQRNKNKESKARKKPRFEVDDEDN